MADPNTPGNETSEWTAFKWVMLICSALAAGLGIVIGSGAVTDPMAQAILGGAAAVLGSIGGLSGKAYIDGRNRIKTAMALPVNPTRPES